MVMLPNCNRVAVQARKTAACKVIRLFSSARKPCVTTSGRMNWTLRIPELHSISARDLASILPLRRKKTFVPVYFKRKPLQCLLVRVRIVIASKIRRPPTLALAPTSTLTIQITPQSANPSIKFKRSAPSLSHKVLNWAPLDQLLIDAHSGRTRKRAQAPAPTMTIKTWLRARAIWQSLVRLPNLD